MATNPAIPEVLLERRTGRREQQRAVSCHSVSVWTSGSVVRLLNIMSRMFDFKQLIGAERSNVCREGLNFFLNSVTFSETGFLDIF